MSKNELYEPFLSKEKFYTLDELANIYGEYIRRNCAISLVLKDEETFTKYKNEDLIEISSGEGVKSVSSKLIQDILSDSGMYKYLQTNLDNRLGIAARFDYIFDSDTIVSIKLTRYEIMEAFTKISDKLNQKEKMRLAVIKNSLDLFSCEQRYSNYTHTSYIDDEKIEIPASILLQILTMDEQSFASFINNPVSFGYKRKHLAYVLIDFIEKERIRAKYVFPEKVYMRYKSLANYQLIDFEALNKNSIRNDYTEEGKSIVDVLTINDELLEYLDKEIDKTYSTLEKSLYYYIKLCELFTSDPNFYTQDYASSRSDVSTKGPNDAQITPKDFIFLYAKLLDHLGVVYSFDPLFDRREGYLSFRCGEFLMELTSFDAIAKNDLANIKVNDEIANLTCINKNAATKQKFSEKINQIYASIKTKHENAKRFSETLAEYQSNLSKRPIPLKEKVFTLLKEICRSNLTGVDIFAYEKKVFSAIFANDKRIKITFMYIENESGLHPVTVISIKDTGYQYFVVDQTSPEIIKPISYQSMQKMVERNDIHYIGDQTILGITDIKEREKTL